MDTGTRLLKKLAQGGALRVAPMALAAAISLSMTAPAHALLFTTSYVDTGTGGVFDAASKAVIQSALDFYQNTFNDSVTVALEFHNDKTFYGGSLAKRYTIDYTGAAGYKPALIADKTSANDATAIANLPASPPTGAKLSISSSNGRAVGLDTPGGAISFPDFCDFTGDGCIGLDLKSIKTAAELLAVVEHEIDEVLGLGSGLRGNADGTGSKGTPRPEDLFRYATPGTLSYDNNTCAAPPQAFFSIDGGNSNLNEFNNCNNGGDYGDWIQHTPGQVQDWKASAGAQPSLNALSTEIVALDVIGWDVPEPATISLLGMGLLAALASRRRRAGKA